MNSIPKEEIEFLKQKYASEEIKAQSKDTLRTAQSRVEKLFKNQPISDKIKEKYIEQIIDAKERLILGMALRTKAPQIEESYGPNSIQRLTPDIYRKYYTKIPKGYVVISPYNNDDKTLLNQSF